MQSTSINAFSLPFKLVPHLHLVPSRELESKNNPPPFSSSVLDSIRAFNCKELAFNRGNRNSSHRNSIDRVLFEWEPNKSISISSLFRSSTLLLLLLLLLIRATYLFLDSFLSRFQFRIELTYAWKKKKEKCEIFYGCGIYGHTRLHHEPLHVSRAKRRNIYTWRFRKSTAFTIPLVSNNVGRREQLLNGP